MNQFGHTFRIQLYGESHGPEIGVIIDGCPPGLPLRPEDFEADLARRRSGAPGTTPRHEADIPLIRSGVFGNHSSGAPICIAFANENTRSADYENIKKTPRPGHADFVAAKRFKGFADYRGGGHFSGRLTLALVTAGVIARKLISPVSIQARLLQAGGHDNIQEAVAQAMKENDSVGGLIECRASQVPVGWGEPFFDSAESMLSHMVFSIPAIKGIEFGSGFAAASMRGSQHNDVILDESGRTPENHAGGISGGLTNGNDLVFRVAVKPTSSIGRVQHTYDFSSGGLQPMTIGGRHDACIALRVPVVLEAATAIVLADLKLRQANIL